VLFHAGSIADGSARDSSNVAEASPRKEGLFKKLLQVAGRKRSSSLEDNQVGSREFIIAKKQGGGEVKFVPREDHPLWKKQEEKEESNTPS